MILGKHDSKDSIDESSKVSSFESKHGEDVEETSAAAAAAGIGASAASSEVAATLLPSTPRANNIMDGFVIELDVDADEQLMVSREEPYKPPDYRHC